METLGASASQTSISTRTEFICKDCNYICSKRSNYNRHLLKCKSNNNTHGDIKETIDEQNEQQSKYTCNICNKIYMSRNGLWKHKQKCISNNDKATCNTDNDITNDINDKNLIMMLIKENKEIKNMMVDIMKNCSNITNNNHINSHNKTFNLQVFSRFPKPSLKSSTDIKKSP